jgi:hypothetical protein
VLIVQIIDYRSSFQLISPLPEKSRQTPARPRDFWNRMEQEHAWGRTQVVGNMVARDGVEPPTPAFSGLRSTT